MSNDLKILDKDKDHVIDSDYLTVKMSYKYALENLHPLINRLDFQRNSLNQKYYNRLKKDIIDGCVLPPVTIAFDSLTIKEEVSNLQDNNELARYICDHIDKGFILDGIQRLNTLKSASYDESFNEDSVIYGNIIISDSINKLLYRMIILNNGQRPMSARHQIEILMERTIEQILENELYNDRVYSEKNSARGDGKTKLKREILVKAYLSYSTKSVTVDNQKIIESKLNEIISEKIIESEIKDSELEFKKIFEFLMRLIDFSKTEAANCDINLIDWFNNENNTIGFFVGIAKDPSTVLKENSKIISAIKTIEMIIETVNPSKVKMSVMRRKVVSDIIKNVDIVNESESIDDYILGL